MKASSFVSLVLGFIFLEGQFGSPASLTKIHQRRETSGLGSLGSLGGGLGSLGSGGLGGLGSGGLGSLGSGGLGGLGSGGLGSLGSGGLSSLGSGGLGSLGSGGLSGLGSSGLGSLGSGGLGNILGAGTTGSTTSTGSGSSSDGCSQYKIISARGTGELQDAATGLAGFVSGLLAALPGGGKYEVQYPATVDYLNGPVQGATDAMKYISQQNSRCPKQSYVLCGYSEGAMVITQLMKKSEIPTSLIVAIVLYGNPYFKGGAPQNACSAKSGSGIASATGIQMPSQYCSIVFDCCLTGDMICQTTGTIVSHLAYPKSQSEKDAVEFATAKLKSALNGGGSPQASPTNTNTNTNTNTTSNTPGTGTTRNSGANNGGLSGLFPGLRSGGLGSLFGNTGKPR